MLQETNFSSTVGLIALEYVEKVTSCPKKYIKYLLNLSKLH